MSPLRSGTVRMTGELTRRHVATWAQPLLEGRRTLVLDAWGGDGEAVSALADAERWEAVSWLDAPPSGLPLHRLGVIAAAGVRLVLGVRGLDPVSAERVAERIGGRVAGFQAIVQGSVITGARAGAIEPAAALDADPRVAHRALIVANVDADETDRALDAVATLIVEPVEATHVERLETAYRALRRANAGLARENLGRHDAAAASVIGRLTTELQAATHQLEIEIEVAARNDAYFQAARRKLGEPHHRAAEKLFQALGRLPAGQAISRRLISRGRGG